MNEMQIGADWYILLVRQNSNDVNKMEVYYEAEYEQDNNLDCYLISMLPEMEGVTPEKKKDTYKSLIEQINENYLMIEHQKMKCLELINEKQSAFGTSYKDLTKTNFVNYTST